MLHNYPPMSEGRRPSVALPVRSSRVVSFPLPVHALTWVILYISNSNIYRHPKRSNAKSIEAIATEHSQLRQNAVPVLPVVPVEAPKRNCSYPFRWNQPRCKVPPKSLSKRSGRFDRSKAKTDEGKLGLFALFLGESIPRYQDSLCRGRKYRAVDIFGRTERKSERIDRHHLFNIAFPLLWQ